jgi:hypothetical protein
MANRWAVVENDGRFTIVDALGQFSFELRLLMKRDPITLRLVNPTRSNKEVLAEHITAALNAIKEHLT